MTSFLITLLPAKQTCLLPVFMALTLCSFVLQHKWYLFLHGMLFTFSLPIHTPLTYLKRRTGCTSRNPFWVTISLTGLSLEVMSPLFFYGCSIYEGSGMISPLELAFMYHVYPQGNCKPQEGRIISSTSFLSHPCQDIH